MPNASFPPLNKAQIELGQLLFYDPILSGNKSVACATCHHPEFKTSDGLSLGVGDGGIGLGPRRLADEANAPHERIPRNAPALFNLGADEYTSFFHDGRLEASAEHALGTRTPLGDEMEGGYSSLLSAQAMFPVLSADEMAGQRSENDVAQAVAQGRITGPDGAWDILAKRVEAIPEYRAAFDKIIGPQKALHMTDISNAMAAFIDFEWRATNSPFDIYLRDQKAMDPQAMAGMELFYGAGGCDSCHSGLFQTDHGFHAIAMPQIGPGKAAVFERHKRDVGRMAVTGKLSDIYAFRTPSLRNVAHTGPYGHSGAYRSLKAVVMHHLDPVKSLREYNTASAILPLVIGNGDFDVSLDVREVDAIASANALQPVDLNAEQVDQIVAFLHALTDEKSLIGALGVPSAVPSGLPLDQ